MTIFLCIWVSLGAYAVARLLRLAWEQHRRARLMTARAPVATAADVERVAKAILHAGLLPDDYGPDGPNLGHWHDWVTEAQAALRAMGYEIPIDGN